MWRGLLVAMFCLLGTGAYAADLNALFKNYDTDSPVGRVRFQDLTKGIEIGAIAMQVFYVQGGKQPKLYCPPVAFTGEQLIGIVREHIKSDPGAAEQDYGMAVTEAIYVKFPCK